MSEGLKGKYGAKAKQSRLADIRAEIMACAERCSQNLRASAPVPIRIHSYDRQGGINGPGAQSAAMRLRAQQCTM